MDGPIASAVVLSEEPLPPASPNSSKRRQLSISEDSAKRPRLNDEDVPVSRRGSTVEAKLAAPVRRERGRERRLFGAVLGALSQAPSTSAAQKRRSEIEKRQLAQRKQESEESEQRKAERIARRKDQRWKEQKRFEVQSMRLRHDNLLNMAHYLQTESTPHLYYKPWETSAEEDARIHDQLVQVRKVIKREIEEHEIRLEKEANEEQSASRDGGAGRDAQGSHSGKERDADGIRQPSATNGHANGSHNSPKDQDMDDDHAQGTEHEAVRIEATEHALDSNVSSHETIADDPGSDHHAENEEDVVEEAAEDTLIY